MAGLVYCHREHREFDSAQFEDGPDASTVHNVPGHPHTTDGWAVVNRGGVWYLQPPPIRVPPTKRPPA